MNFDQAESVTNHKGQLLNLRPNEDKKGSDRQKQSRRFLASSMVATKELQLAYKTHLSEYELLFTQAQELASINQ